MRHRTLHKPESMGQEDKAMRAKKVSLVKASKRPEIFMQFLTFSRWILVVFCVSFASYGWYCTITKYLLNHTSIAISVNETDRILYPSITFCRTLKGDRDIPTLIKDYADRLGVDNIDRFPAGGVTAVIANYSYKHTDFLSIFSHSETGLLGDGGVSILHNDALWSVTIPHPAESGVCYTYDPPFSSPKGPEYGIRFGLYFPEAENLTQVQKETLLSTVNIYLHKKGHFIYYSEDDRPFSAKIDESWFGFNQETSISVDMVTSKRLSTNTYPCTNDENFSFNLCLEKTYSKIRGCQPPWYFFDAFDIPVCKNISDIYGKFRSGDQGEALERDWSRPHWVTTGLAGESKCDIPCTSYKYGMEYSYQDLAAAKRSATDGPATWVVDLYFKNLLLKSEEEYVTCDYTCMLGEIGGNLGFFLGGSVLDYVDVISEHVMQATEARKALE